MSEAGRYTKLLPQVTWRAAERRDPDPVNQLGRRLESVCQAAVDPYEVTAYLESIGYNRYRVRQEFGLSSPFELAERLYTKVPRRATAKQHIAGRAETVWPRHLAIVLTFVATLVLQSSAAPTGFEAVLWLILWSVVGSGVVGTLFTESDRRQQSVISALLGIGLCGLLAALPAHGFSWTEFTVSLLWWNLTGTLWLAQAQGERLLLPSLLPVAAVGGTFTATLAFPHIASAPFTAPFAALLSGVGLPLWSCAAAAALASLWVLSRRNLRLESGTWRYLVTSPGRIALLALYGGGQGFLLVTLLQTETDYLLLGTLLLAVVVTGFEWAANGLARSLAQTLWSSVTRYTFQQRAGRAASLWLFLLLVPVVFVATRAGQVPYGTVVYSFLLLGFSLGLGLTLLNLKNLSLPSLAFAVTAAAVLLGFPFVNAVATLVACLSFGLLFHLRSLESYGVQVL